MPRRLRVIKPTTYGRPLQSSTSHMENNKQWEYTSLAQRDTYPACYDPYEIHIPHIKQGILRHHVLPVSHHSYRMYDPEVTRTLCSHCHNRVEGDTKKGKAVKRMFDMCEDERLTYLIGRCLSVLARGRGDRGVRL